MRGGESSSMNVRREKSKLGKEEMEMVSVIKEKHRDKKKGAGIGHEFGMCRGREIFRDRGVK
jgi:hypothetical protein